MESVYCTLAPEDRQEGRERHVPSACRDRMSQAARDYDDMDTKVQKFPQ